MNQVGELRLVQEDERQVPLVRSEEGSFAGGQVCWNFGSLHIAPRKESSIQKKTCAELADLTDQEEKGAEVLVVSESQPLTLTELKVDMPASMPGNRLHWGCLIKIC